MYTNHEGQEQDLQKRDIMDCLDQEQMQAMQDQFCQTQGCYCVCVSRNMRRLTSFSGTKEEQVFIDRVFPVATQRNLIASFSDVGGEDVIAVESGMPCVQLRGIAFSDSKGGLTEPGFCLPSMRNWRPRQTRCHRSCAKQRQKPLMRRWHFWMC